MYLERYIPEVRYHLLVTTGFIVHNPVLAFAKRNVVQSQKGSLRSILDIYPDRLKSAKLFQNSCGNYYRLKRKWWSCETALEVSLTKHLYSTVERTPLCELPMISPPPIERLLIDGEGGADLLLNLPEKKFEGSNSLRPRLLVDENQEAYSEISHLLPITQKDSLAKDEKEVLVVEDIGDISQHSIMDKMISDDILEGGVLESVSLKHRQKYVEDLLCSNELSCSPSDARREGGISWIELNLDPIIAERVYQKIGPSPTKLQSLLIPSLLNEAHRDVLLSGVTGSGKTTALLISLLQGVFSESAGMNIYIASNSVNAKRAYDTVHSLCMVEDKLFLDPFHSSGLIKTAKTHAQDGFYPPSAPTLPWVLLGTFISDCEAYYSILKDCFGKNHRKTYTKASKQLRLDNGEKMDSPYIRLLITTADVLARLLFEMKLEFKSFGYLRRIYVDDIVAQIPVLSKTATVEEVRQRLRDPLAAELLLGTLHQLPGPHIRSLLQMAFVSAGVCTQLKQHLESLCIKKASYIALLAPAQLPTTVRCLFSFYISRQTSLDLFVVEMVRKLDFTIPGRAVFFVRDNDDILEFYVKLRRLGMNINLLSEIFDNKTFFREDWKFLLLHEAQAHGIDFPLLSHVFITFPPSTRQNFLHMAGRVGRLGNLGWVFVFCNRQHIVSVREVAEELNIDMIGHVIDKDLRQISSDVIKRWSDKPTSIGIDPQYVVQKHYENQSENPDYAMKEREIFSKPVNKQFFKEDYTPLPVLNRRFRNAKKMRRDIELNPSIAINLQEQGFFNKQFRPTKHLYRALATKKHR